MTPDDFIGRSFGENGQIEVIGWHGEMQGYNKLYTIKCHKCATDPDLHGTATYTITKFNLLRGTHSCGCGKTTRWRQEQYPVLLDRACLAKGFQWRYLDDDLVTQQKKVGVSCDKCHHEWSTRISLVLGDAGCPRCSIKDQAELRTRSPDEWVEVFKSTGVYPEGTVFRLLKTYSKNSERAEFWEVECPICVLDEFATNGLCNGRFTAHTTNLQAGKKSCRCSQHYRWTTGQREYQILKSIEENTRPYRLLRWVEEEGYVNSKSKIMVECRIHGEWDAYVTSFLQGSGCPVCASSGFKTYKDGALYVLLAEGRHSFAGFGISNVADRRLNEHARNLKRAGFTLGQTQIFHMTGQQAWDVEQLLKKTFPCNPQDVVGFRTEATYYEHYQAVCDFVDKWLFENA